MLDSTSVTNVSVRMSVSGSCRQRGVQEHRGDREEHDEALRQRRADHAGAENIGAPTGRGGRSMTSPSSCSASNTTEQAGSMMSSRNAMWIGMSTSGSLSSTGRMDMSAMGTWTARM